MIIQNISIDAKKPAWWLIFHGNEILHLPEQPGLLQHSWQELEFLHSYEEQIVQVGEYQQQPCYMLDLQRQDPQHPEAQPTSLRQFLIQSDQALFNIASRAWQVALFLRTHRFCGQCGERMHNVGWELAMQCHRCQHRTYPRISPCIIVAIRHQDKILLAQGKHHKNDMHSTLAGFVESGESLEQAVHREVKEEVGINIHNLRYYGSQPWPFPHQLMCGYLADYHSGDIVIDEKEIVKADWFTADNLPNIPPNFSIAGQLIAETLKLME